jgi:prevent-host-death family protein
MKTVTAADANRQFSRVLREVAQGEVFTVVSRGKPVATIGPAHKTEATRHTPKETLMARLRSQSVTGARTWTRDELYED